MAAGLAALGHPAGRVTPACEDCCFLSSLPLTLGRQAFDCRSIAARCRCVQADRPGATAHTAPAISADGSSPARPHHRKRGQLVIRPERSGLLEGAVTPCVPCGSLDHMPGTAPERRDRMSMKHVLSAGMGLLTLGLIATTAQAAPTIGFAGATGAEAAGAGLLEKAHWYGRRYHYRPYYY